MTAVVDPFLLAKAWAPRVVQQETAGSSDGGGYSVSDSRDLNSTSSQSTDIALIQKAIQRTIPLLEDYSSVPFVCRYRTDLIFPLSTTQTHYLFDLTTKHASLNNLRKKLLDCIDDPKKEKSLVEYVQTSTSKSELEDLYAPFKPAPKGSIIDRIQAEHPQLIQRVDDVWSSRSPTAAAVRLKYDPSLESHVVHLLSTKLSSLPEVMTRVTEELEKHCRISSTVAVSKSKKEKSSSSSSSVSKYQNYNDFSRNAKHLQNHQVLAIQRGVNEKEIQLGFDIDAQKMEGCIKYTLFQVKSHLKQSLSRSLLDAAVHDAWTRLLRRRGTSRLWKEKCAEAKRRSIVVFQDNLRRALLAPPLLPPRPLLALDPGFQAGIKSAILNAHGDVVQLETVQFLGKKEAGAIERLRELILSVKEQNSQPVIIALGNGHGSQEARALVEQAVTQLPSSSLRIELVNEAGASVWSVTEGAKKEFPNEPPSSVAAISIGRRLLNPLNELVKVPPKSLGLGMYQHDLSEKELDEKLQMTSVDAVATVGVDANSASLEILQKVPGLAKLAEKVIRKRPILRRSDLLDVPGLGPKTFENCAAFCRVTGPEPLDTTLVHPESYDLARWLLKKFSWKLSEKPKNIPPTIEWNVKWKKEVKEASKKFKINEERVLAVMKNLVDSMLQVDPRIEEKESHRSGGEAKVESSLGSINGCVLLSPDLADESKLQSACPVRGIIATVRNIADFGAFMDFGGHNDGLLHTSKLGPVKIETLLIGQQVGVDILSVSDDGRTELGLYGLNSVPASFGGQSSRGGVAASKTSSAFGSSRVSVQQRRNASSQTRTTTSRSSNSKGSSSRAAASSAKATTTSSSTAAKKRSSSSSKTAGAQKRRKT